MNTSALYNLSETRPTQDALDEAHHHVGKLWEYIQERRGWIASQILALTDVELARALPAARVIERNERGHRACVLYVAAMGHGSRGIPAVRRDHHDARKLVRFLTVEANARIARYREGARLITKSLKAAR